MTGVFELYDTRTLSDANSETKVQAIALHLYSAVVRRGVSGKKRHITCRPIGKIFMLIMATLPSNLILYL